MPVTWLTTRLGLGLGIGLGLELRACPYARHLAIGLGVQNPNPVVVTWLYRVRRYYHH